MLSISNFREPYIRPLRPLGYGLTTSGSTGTPLMQALAAWRLGSEVGGEFGDIAENIHRGRTQRIAAQLAADGDQDAIDAAAPDVQKAATGMLQERMQRKQMMDSLAGIQTPEEQDKHQEFLMKMKEYQSLIDSRYPRAQPVSNMFDDARAQTVQYQHSRKQITDAMAAAQASGDTAAAADLQQQLAVNDHLAQAKLSALGDQAGKPKTVKWVHKTDNGDTITEDVAPNDPRIQQIRTPTPTNVSLTPRQDFQPPATPTPATSGTNSTYNLNLGGDKGVTMDATGSDYMPKPRPTTPPPSVPITTPPGLYAPQPDAATPAPLGPNPLAPGPITPQGTPDGRIRVANQADVDRLPKGTRFVGPDGADYIKQ